MMEFITWLLLKIDPVLITPYRFFSSPMLGWWVGTSILALWAVLLGELTMVAAYRLNRQAMDKSTEKALYYQEQSLKAKQINDEKSYKMINKLANEAYGKSFFLSMAMGMGSLWPAFFAAAWLNERFKHIVFALPSWIGGFELNFLAPFIFIFIILRIFLYLSRPYIALLRAPAKNLSSNSFPHR
jgi:hypothetical protein